MQIIPHLWFDDRSEEAALFYISLFNDSKITNTTRYGKAGAEASGRPEGSVMNVEFELAGQRFLALDGGPAFKLNPSISLTVRCDSKEEIDSLWERLSEAGKVLMELDSYDWSDRYGWVQDRFGLSWQLMLVSHEQKIVPSFLFVGGQFGRGKEAIEHYEQIFPDSEVLELHEEGDHVLHANFTLNGQEFILAESNLEHEFSFNEAFSLLVECDSQQEIDQLWEGLSAVPEVEMCGWLKDRFGVSWQIAPSSLSSIMRSGDEERKERAMKAMLKMKKIDASAFD